MILNCSFHKLMIEDLKHRIWLPIFSTYLYITYILDFALSQANQKLFIGDSTLGPANQTVLYITIFLAVITAIQGFSFLFSERKTNFYFSLPIKRRNLFFSTYINGLLFSLFPCVLARLVCYFIEDSRSPEALRDTWFGILVNILGFLMIYHLTICVMVLTGQIITSVLGIIFVFFYGIFTFGFMFQKYSSLFFDTYYKIDLINKLATYVSPYHLYNTLCGSKTMQEIGTWKLMQNLPMLLSVLIISGVFLSVGYFLFLKRPAEAAGSPIAFQHSETILKFIFSVPVILVVGYYTMSLSISNQSLAFLVVGILFASFFMNGLCEALFQSDIKSLFNHRIHAISLTVICIAISACFYFDIWNFDTYSLQSQNIDSAAVYIYGLDDSEEIPAGRTLSEFYRADMQLDTMLLTKETKDNLLIWVKNLQHKAHKNEKPLTYAAIAYRTKNGQSSYRKYPIYSFKDLNQFSSVYDTADYKKSAYALLSDTHIGTRHFVWSNGVESFHLNLTEQENELLLKKLQEDSLKQTLTDLQSDLPIGTLSLVYTGSETGDTLFLYPTFKNTLSYLQTLGLPATKTINNYKITNIQIYEKFSKTTTFGKVINSRKRILNSSKDEEIKQWYPVLLPTSYTINPLFCPVASQYQATVTIQDDHEKAVKYITMTLKNDEITDSLPSLGE